MWKQREASVPATIEDLRARATQLRQDMSTSLARAIDEFDSRSRELESAEFGLDRVIDELQRERQDAFDIFEFSPNPYVVTDGHYTVVEINRAAAVLLDVLPATLVGETWPDVLGVEEFPHHPDGKGSSARGGDDGEGDVHLGSDLLARVVQLPARPGSSERYLWHLRRAPPTVDGNGAKSSTEKAPLAFLRRAIDECVVGVILVESLADETVFLNRSAAKLLGRPDAGKRGIERFDGAVSFPNGRPHAISALCHEHIFRGKSVVGESVLLRTRNGSPRWIRVCGGPVLDAGGKVVGGLLVADDISAIHDEQQRHAEWLSMVVHDLRAPLAVISGYAQLLQKDFANQAAGSGEPRALQTIRANAVRLNRMVSDLLDASRIDISKLSLQRQRTNLVAVVQRLAEDTQQTAPDRPVQVVGGERPECLVLADPQRIEQVLDNLLQNAIKYGTPGTPIQVGVDCDERAARVWVTNQGPGILPRDANQLFRRIHRAGVGTESKSGGLGLGLYIARGIVEAHGGTLSVESVPNQTTTFTLTLPTAAAIAGPGIQNAW